MFSLQRVANEIEIIGFHNIYYFEFGKDFTHIPEKHDFWEMVYVDSGEIIAVTDGIGTALKQGSIIFHEPGEIHAHISNREIPNNMLVVSFSCDSPAMRHFRKKTFTTDKTAKTLLSLFIGEAQKALGSIPSEYTDTRDLDFTAAAFGSGELMLCYLTELLIHCVRLASENGSKITPTEKSRALASDSVIELVIEYMKAHLNEPLTQSDICREFLIGKSQLSAIFKSSTGSSVMHYFMTLKITEAKRLLRCNELTVGEIADHLGFSCIHTFSRTFKASVGKSPTAYQSTIWSGGQGSIS